MSEFQKIKILIVDDEKIIIDIMSARLKKMMSSAVIISLTQPENIIEQVKIHKPSIILLDFFMPSLSGVECLKLLRTQYSKIEMPVIMLTSEDSSEVISQCFDSGANDYIIKGALVSVIFSRINAQLDAVSLIKERVILKELEAIMALVVSYNHEINNPLAIAIGYLSMLKKNNDDPKIAIIEESLKRVSEVLKNIKNIGEKFELEYKVYSGESKSIKIP